MTLSSEKYEQYSHLMINVSPQRANSVRASGDFNLTFIPSTNLHNFLSYNFQLQYQKQDVKKKTLPYTN